MEDSGFPGLLEIAAWHWGCNDEVGERSQGDHCVVVGVPGVDGSYKGVSGP